MPRKNLLATSLSRNAEEEPAPLSRNAEEEHACYTPEKKCRGRTAGYTPWEEEEEEPAGYTPEKKCRGKNMLGTPLERRRRSSSLSDEN